MHIKIHYGSQTAVKATPTKRTKLHYWQLGSHIDSATHDQHDHCLISITCISLYIYVYMYIYMYVYINMFTHVVRVCLGMGMGED
jgi:hypothetical protein